MRARGGGQPLEPEDYGEVAFLTQTILTLVVFGYVVYYVSVEGINPRSEGPTNKTRGPRRSLAYRTDHISSLGLRVPWYIN